MDRFLCWEMSEIRRYDLLASAGVIRQREGARPPGAFVTAAMSGFADIARGLARKIATALRQGSEPTSARSAAFAACRPPLLSNGPKAHNL